ncbi:MAG: plasmid mobilization protein, partial [Faecousia sp.]
MTLTIRVTPGEKAAILRKAKQAGLSPTDYLVTAAQSTQIFVAEDLKPALTEMKRIGNNLNQITAKINVGAFKSYNFSEVIEWQLKAELGIAKREILKRIEVMEKQGGSSREKFFSDLSEMQSSA